MSSIFSKIVAGEIPCYKIAENDEFLAFLDVFPLKRGHVLVIPKQEVDYIFDIDDATLGNLHIFSKSVAKAIGKVIPCKRVGTAVIGLEVPHTHVHLTPINSVGDINFAKPKLTFSHPELAEIAASIAANFV